MVQEMERERIEKEKKDNPEKFIEKVLIEESKYIKE